METEKRQQNDEAFQAALKKVREFLLYIHQDAVSYPLANMDLIAMQIQINELETKYPDIREQAMRILRSEWGARGGV